MSVSESSNSSITGKTKPRNRRSNNNEHVIDFMPHHAQTIDHSKSFHSTTSAKSGNMSITTEGSSRTNYTSSIEESTCSSDDGVQKVKCILVGDGAVGKTSLIVSYTTNGYPNQYQPTAFDNYTVEVTVNSRPIRLDICDTAGQDDLDSIRPLCYPNADIFLCCFSIANPVSLQSIVNKWLPEIRLHAPKTPIILLGTQSDLRDDVKIVIDLNQHNQHPVTESEAMAVAFDISAITYMEVSALTQKNLKEVFDTVILTSLDWNGYQKKLHRQESKRFSKHRKKFQKESELIPVSEPTSQPSKRGWRKLLCVS